MSSVPFTLPELGENVPGGDVLRVLVAPGDTIARDQPVVELETDKATLEVPSSVEGRVTEVRVKPGQRINVGDVVLVVESAVEAGESPGAAEAPAPLSGAAAGTSGGAGRAAGSSTAGAAPGGAPEWSEAPVASGDLFDDEADLGAEDEADLATPGGEAAAEGGRPPVALRPGAPDDDQGDPERRRSVGAAAPPGPIEFALPSLGENVPGGDVLRVLVRPGDEVARDQPVLELETDKATFEVPSSIAGRVTEVRVKEGDRVVVGQVVLIIDAPQASAPPPPPALKFQRVHAAPPPREASSAAPGAAAGGEPPGGAPTEPRGAAPDKPGMLEDALEEARAEAAQRGPRGAVVPMPSRTAAAEAASHPAPAAPSVRRVARELGVDIHQVPGSGPGGRISAEDVKAYVKRVMSSGGPKVAAPAPAAVGALAAPPLPDFSKWGEVERVTMRAVRRKTAEHLSVAWAQIPHVTQHARADVTTLEELRKAYGKQAEAAGGKLTMTAIALKVVASALKVFPQFNASIDVAAGEIVLKKYVHMGVAVDTERGLIVPVIRDADTKNIVELSAELAQLSEKARTAKTSMEELQGGCFTITNLGGIGGTAFTPIVNYPEVAILGMSRAMMEAVWIDGAFQPRLMLPLSLSYDHRVIDGADGMRFLKWICDALEQPFLLSLQG
jgi:pyruvate dehydrogenase E2 component (dihydrolipoamide acetyltransferase)